MRPRERPGRRTAIILAGGALGVLGSLDACRAPTQVTIVVETPTIACSALQGIAIYVDGDSTRAEEEGRPPRAPTATVVTCESDRRAGSLVVVPAGGRGAIVVVAGVRERADRCGPDNEYAGCIVARRAFSFIEHVPLTIPVPLDLACVDVPCSAQSTCSDRRCVSSEVSCDESGCKPPGELPDGGTALVDAPTSNEASAADGGSTVDASLDAPADAPKDSGTNTCDPRCSTSPTPSVGMKCSLIEQTCCKNDQGGGGGANPEITCAPTCAGETLCCLGREDCSNAARHCCFPKGGGTTAACRDLAECGTVVCRGSEDCIGTGDACNTGTSSVYGVCMPL